MEPVTFTHTTGSEASDPSSHNSLERLMGQVNLNGCEARSDTSSISELWRLHSSSVILPTTVSQLFDLHSTFTKIESVYLRSIASLSAFPTHINEDEFQALCELEVRSDEDLAKLWEKVTRIATASMLAAIVCATPTRDSQRLIAHAESYLRALEPVQLQFALIHELTLAERRHAIERYRVYAELIASLRFSLMIPSDGTMAEFDQRMSDIFNAAIGLVNHEMVAFIAKRVIEILAMSS